MVHVAPGRGRVICLDPSHEDTWTWGAMHIAEWDNTEQIRQDFRREVN
jgi:hypothetical protein